MTYVNEYLLRRNLLILPRIEGDKLTLHLAEGRLIPNCYGILEPQKEAPLGIPTLALIPGLAFDTDGNRIGYGKGFYDRLLPQLDAYKIGIAYEEQLYNKISTEAHDYPVDRVLTF